MMTDGASKRWDVFIAKNSTDLDHARRVHDFLTGRGVRVFLSEVSIPEVGMGDYQEAIEQALEDCTHMIVVASTKENIESQWVKAEWRMFLGELRAGRKDGNILTVLAGEMPVTDVPLGLRTYQCLRLSDDALPMAADFVCKSREPKVIEAAPAAPQYVKICPKCGGHNPEIESTCGECGYFLGMVRAIVPPPKAEKVAAPPEAAGKAEPPREPSSQEDEAAPRLFMDSVSTGASFEVRPGFKVGQAHPTSRSDVQMSGIPNLNFVSREHCHFDYENGAWFVTALPSAMNGTFVNQVTVAQGGRVRIRHGDELTLANVPFRIRISDG